MTATWCVRSTPNNTIHAKCIIKYNGLRGKLQAKGCGSESKISLMVVVGGQCINYNIMMTLHHVEALHIPSTFQVGHIKQL